MDYPIGNCGIAYIEQRIVVGTYVKVVCFIYLLCWSGVCCFINTNVCFIG